MGTILALAASVGSASARKESHHRYGHTRTVHHVRAPLRHRHAWRRHAWIMGDRQNHRYYIQLVSSDWPPSADRIYFRTAAAARAAGYRPVRRDVVPVNPRLTWQNWTGLPSLGKQRQPPPPPPPMDRPVAPPDSQQPLVTPTEPRPN
jgi:hypothetical protein